MNKFWNSMMTHDNQFVVLDNLLKNVLHKLWA